MPLLVPIFVPRVNISLALSPIFTSASLLNTRLALFASLSHLYLFPSVILLEFYTNSPTITPACCSIPSSPTFFT
ncbi:hypothetical protein FOXYSP1_07377 [Fusarium oxysporum f. sp. phaseoli]